jgi:RNA polymerase sigma factor (TIGR02999 family)
MAATSPQMVTQLLLNWNQGDQAALDKLMPIVYDELRRLARHYLGRERGDHTLQASALVHEAYLRLVDQSVSWQNRAHFFGIAARLMRQILVDHARRRQFAKRGGGQLRVSLTKAGNVSYEQSPDFVALDEALTELAGLDAQQSQIVELRYFGGLTIEETAEVLGVSTDTVKRKWNVARAWLRQELQK